MQRFNFSHYKLFIAENVIVSLRRLIEIAKFESLLRISVSKPENILERTMHKAMAQSCQNKFLQIATKPNSKFHVI